ncbi:unnamed protein product [Rotaria socialis]|uniref:SH3 domain-containing protein n=1 Tax=Rotaria socialis TaxID=392032 RepID=A0A817N5S0_9BILA|nr:unnamed protein product [Rotaria socialis]
MLSQLRRGHHHEFDGDPMSARPINAYGERWRSPDRANSSLFKSNILPDFHTPRTNSSTWNPDLSRAFRVDAQLLAIVRIEDKRNSFYSAEVVSKLRQKEQTQKFINKPCSLFVNDRSFIIFDRGAQVIAETIPLENVDPTCVYSDAQDTLNDIFMYRVLDRHIATASQASNSNSNELTHAIVFKCSNKESKLLVDNIRNATGRPLKSYRSTRSETRSTIDHHFNGSEGGPLINPQPLPHEPLPINTSTYVVGPQHSSRTATQQHAANLYKRSTEELNKCFDDIELFVRHIEAIVEYTKELERNHRRKDKKSSGLKQMVEKLPEDRIFIDILQKFKHSLNLLAELKHIIHNPNAHELVHYLLSPLQLILVTLRTKHPNQLQLAQDIWSPVLTREAKELLSNCLTPKEYEILWNLGPAWIRTAEGIPQKNADYRPTFFDGHPPWVQEPVIDYTLQSARNADERQTSVWPSSRIPQQNNNNNNNNSSIISQNIAFPRQPSPGPQFDTSTADRKNKNPVLVENYNAQMQNEHAWAIDRKRVGAKICAVKSDRQGQNHKELTVRRGELVEIENSSKNWWRARNFRGDIGHVPHNLLEEIDIEQLTPKSAAANTSAALPRSSSVPNRGFTDVNGHHPHNTNGYTQQLRRSPSFGSNFIMQSNNSTYTNPIIARDQLIQQTYPSPVPPLLLSPHPLSVPLPPPPPPPPPMPLELLTSGSSPWSTLQLPNSSRKARSRSNTNLSNIQADELQQELAQRLTDRIGLISSNSSKEDIERWLASKSISPELAQSLHGMNGKELFQLTKSGLDRFTNEQESARIYALLAQQKQLSGYQHKDIRPRSARLNHTTFGSLKSSTINDADDNFSLRPDDTLSRSLKIKLKQRRDKIEKAETADSTVL